MLMKFKFFLNRFFWITPFLSFILGYLFISIIFPKKEFIVPNLTGKSLQNSLYILSNKSLNLNMLKELVVKDLPEGTILSQVPAAGNKVKKNQNIFVTVSKKPKASKVPDFIDLDSKTINEQSSSLNISPRFYWLETLYPINKCFAQTPRPEQDLDDKKVILYLSKGLNSFYIIPNFKGCSFDSLNEYIDSEKVNLDFYAKNEKILTRNKKELFVAEQKPMPGSIVDLSKRLYLQVQVE